MVFGIFAAVAAVPVLVVQWFSDFFDVSAPQCSASDDLLFGWERQVDVVVPPAAVFSDLRSSGLVVSTKDTPQSVIAVCEVDGHTLVAGLVKRDPGKCYVLHQLKSEENLLPYDEFKLTKKVPKLLLKDLFEDLVQMPLELQTPESGRDDLEGCANVKVHATLAAGKKAIMLRFGNNERYRSLTESPGDIRSSEIGPYADWFNFSRYGCYLNDGTLIGK